MAYSTDNPPRCAVSAVGASGPNIWTYDSADAATVVRVTGYITNGDELGMKVGDMVYQGDTAGGTVAHLYTVVSVASGGAADLSDGTAIVATDTD
jgi:hypothetical protein